MTTKYKKYIGKKCKRGMTVEEAKNKWKEYRTNRQKAFERQREKEERREEREANVFWAWKVLNQTERLVEYFRNELDENVYLDLVREWFEWAMNGRNIADDEEWCESIVKYYIDHYVDDSERDEKSQLWKEYNNE